MQRTRRPQFNTLNAPSLARWIILAAFIGLTGLVYVYLNVQLYHLGDNKKALENELARIRSENEVANVQIAALTSRSALQRRLKEGYLKMVAIPDESIVRLSVPLPSASGDDLIPVSNRR